MKLSDAILKGAEIIQHRKSYGMFLDHIEQSACALGAAYIGVIGMPDWAAGAEDSISTTVDRVNAVLRTCFPMLFTEEGSYSALARHIIALSDDEENIFTLADIAEIVSRKGI